MRSIETSRSRMRTSVHIDFTPDVCSTFIDNEDAFLRGDLDDFHRIGCGEHTRTTWRRTHSFRVVLRFIHGMVVINRGGPWLKWNPGLGRSSATLTTTTTTA